MQEKINQLLKLIKEGDESAFSQLEEIFRPLISVETQNMLVKFEQYRSESDEIRQEARMALYKAAMRYDINDKVTFGLYAKICVHNRIVSYFRKLRTKKQREARILAAQKESPSGYSDYRAAMEESEALQKVVKEDLTALESTVFSMYLDKKSYKEIAAVIGKSEKAVDNAIFRVKKKIKNKLM